ncbi:hypothetical protein DN051_40810 (plasmid) [Streptomyces cadmiisoli]|uniref:Uncharacterized protein n=1 Tax=Streptomyces cadmiisoli TaxID=2184053 RepID=A0A2Z4JD48_9ACTN|nr:hypothetical protein DN051_40810 [Streptomyces cadmiisoli]
MTLGVVQHLQEAVAVGRGQELPQGVLVLRHAVEVARREERGGPVQQVGDVLDVAAQAAQLLLPRGERLADLYDLVLGPPELCGELVQTGFCFQGALLLLELLDVRDGAWPVEFRVGVDAGQQGEGGTGSGAGPLLLLEFPGGRGDVGAFAGEAGGLGEEGVELGLVAPAQHPVAPVVDAVGVVLLVAASAAFDKALPGDGGAGWCG